MRALLTGAGGFAGRHLIERLLAEGHEVVASDHGAPAGLPAGVETVRLDVTDAEACWNVIHDSRPDALFHLAAQAHVSAAEADPERTLAVNVGGTRNVLEACLDGHANVRVLFVSSAEVYGRVEPGDLPVREDQPLRPATLYAVSKAQGEAHVHHAVARGLHAVVARSFNHIGPGQADSFVTGAFAHQVARIEAGDQEPVIRVGNLEAVRDLCDVRDVARAYIDCISHGQPGDVFNVTSGRGVRIADLLEGLVELARVDVKIEVDPARLRPLDVPVFHGCGERLAGLTGFRASVPLQDTLRDVLDGWRAVVRADAAGEPRA